MTIQKTAIRVLGKIYEVILEDGMVSYLDPQEPETLYQVGNGDQKVTSIITAKKMALQAIERLPSPMMTFSD